MSVQPVRLFGDPVLRTRAQEVTTFDRELRNLVADLTDTMHEEGGAGLAAPQLGVGLRVFSYDCDGFAGHLVNPTFDVVGDEEQLGPEGCLSIPGLSWDCRRHLHVVARGWDQHGEPVTVQGSDLLARCIQHETDHLDGVLFVDRLDPATRKLAMAEIRAAEWFGAERAGGQGQPAPDVREGQVAPVRLVFAGTPEPAVPSLRALLESGRHEVVAVLTRPDAPAGRGRTLTRSPVGRLADEAGVPVLTPPSPSDPEFLARLRELAPDCCPVVAYGALVPRAALDVPAARLGQPALLAAARPGAAPRRCRPRCGTATRSPAPPRSGWRRAWTPARPSAWSPRPIGPTDTAGALLDRLATSGAALLLATMDGIADGTLTARPQPADGVSHAPKVTVADAAVDWAAPPLAVDRLIRSVTPEPGAWTTFRGDAARASARCTRRSPTRRRAQAGASCTWRSAGCWWARPPRRCSWARCGRSASAPMPAPDWARGVRIEPGELLT